MQRDLKIGISLCVLMFGVVGALMFRREQPAPASQTLQLKTARQLDQKIAQRARTPYMTGDIEHDEDSDPGPRDPQDGTRPAHLLPPNHLLEEDDGILATHPGRSTQSRSGTNSAHSHGESTPRIVTENVIAGVQTHTIHAGDTLSSLAEKYLGSQKRFQEIFDANRNVLTSPDRLPEGVVISIPPAVKEMRRVPDQKSAGSHVSHEGPKKHQTLRPDEDLTTIEPIAPARANTLETVNSSAGSKGADETKSAALDVDGKHIEGAPAETKKRFFAPSRLPFSNQPNHRSTPNRKTLDPDGEAFPGVKDATAVDAAHDAAVPQTYQVRKGDSLERISQKVYGNSKRAADIFNANRNKLASPDAVREGLELELP